MQLWIKANHIGLLSSEGYEFNHSEAFREGKFLGLILDIENQDDLSESRIKNWIAQLREEMNPSAKVQEQSY